MTFFVIRDSLSSLFTPIRCFPHEHFKPGLHSGIVRNY
jgi:hypothetical protein